MSLSQTEKIDLTVEWIRKIVKESGTKGILVGVSGGIDSAVVACLIKKAFPENSVGVILPCKSNPKDEADAQALIETCGIDSMRIDLSETHELLFSKIEEALSDKQVGFRKLADANLRARLRMSTLYGIANALGYLVAGTDNKAEIHTGYYTKYGDGGVDLVPLANLLKSEVYEWARILGVPQSILDRQPSAGLWDGQTDEDEMGTTYEKIDAFLSGKVIPEKDQSIIDRLHKNSEHKRQMPPAPPLFD
ncbi:NAD(+) synthase [Fusibacter tunisiensis]|uniref:NH(3)-dependent NAD(+) synthetase n=1 Tax=Fusibacter tunisiensis TaxID=1008308 RepID=A0ABS2MQP8_9FIRM|nr:NAD(+) synthase [Fusibacter tunisiensis]MBM7561662.1 NAD+ synthase [Fusibacter tunisiensis]